MADVRIHPITAGRFEDLVDLFGTKGDPSWCWCTYFLTTGSDYGDSREDNQATLRQHVARSKHTVGLIAYATTTPCSNPAARRWGGSSWGGSDLYHGAASTFEAAGFEVVGRTGPARPVMRLEL